MILYRAPASAGGRRLFIGIPAYGDLPGAFVHSLLISQTALTQAGYSVELVILSGHCHVDDARSVLFSHFLGSDAEEFVLIDADMSWESQELLRLARHDRDVVAAACIKKSDEEQFACCLNAGEIWADDAGLIEVHAVGSAFIKFKRHVIQSIHEVSNKFWASDALIQTSDMWSRGIRNGQRVSADINLCAKWKDLGGKIYVDPEIRVGHVGTKEWTGIYGSYLRRQSGLDLIPWIKRIKTGSYERRDVLPFADDWGGDVNHELVAACIDIARQANGPIVEVGAGLTSVAMAATGAEVHVLERDPVLASRVTEKRLELPNLRVTQSPPWERCDIAVGGVDPSARPRLVVMKGLETVDGYASQVVGSIKPFVLARRME